MACLVIVFSFFLKINVSGFESSSYIFGIVRGIEIEHVYAVYDGLLFNFLILVHGKVQILASI